MDNILVSSEYDNSSFAKGITEMINDLKKASAAQKEAQEQFSKTSNQIENVEAEIKRLSASYAGLDKSSKDYNVTALSVQTEITKLNAEHLQLTESLKREGAELDGLGKKYGQGAKAVDNFNNAQQGLKDSMLRTEIARKAMLDGLNQTEANLNSKWGAAVKKATDETNRLKASVEAFGGGVTKFNPSPYFDNLGKAAKKTLDKDLNPVINKSKTNFLDLARVIQDLPFGFTGIQNNLTQLIPGVGAAGLAFSALISAITFAQVGLTYWSRGGKDADETAKKLKTSIDTLNNAFADSKYTEAASLVNELSINIGLAKQGFLDKTKVLHQYNETIGKTTGEVKSLDEAEQALVKNGDAYVRMMLYKAAANLALQESAKKMVEVEQTRLKSEKEFINVLDRSNQFNIQSEADALRATAQISKNANARKDAQIKAAKDAADAQLSIAKKFQQDAATISSNMGWDFFGGSQNAKQTKEKKAPENVYEQRLKELKARLAALNETVFSSEDTIRAKISAQLDKENAEVDKLFKERKLTKSQSASLKSFLGIISDVELSKALKEFNDKRKAALKEINGELEKVRNEEAEKRFANIEDEFTRERQLITFELLKGTSEIERRRDELIEKALAKKNLGTITPAEYQKALEEITTTSDKLIEDLQNYIDNKNTQLGFKFLQVSIDELNNDLKIATNQISENAQLDVQNAAQMYKQGKINYAQYQKELTRISNLENEARVQNTRIVLEKEIARVQQRLLGENNKAQKKALELQLSELKKALATNNASLATQTADGLTKEEQKHLEHLNKILSMYSDFTSIVAGFLNSLSQQEQQRLDRSIAIQQQRVDYAKEIAAKGNAEYLELEQKRLDELQRKREEAARKQLAIDNALRLSQATVAAVSAIAYASASGDPFAAVAAGIAVLGAIAAAYAFVSSLQAPTAEFFEGTTFVEGEPGRDKIRAKVTRGEAIIPVDKNQRYKDAVEAIYYERVPAEVLNQFVANYPETRYPVIDYSRLGLATDRHISWESNSEVTSRLDKVNLTMEKVVESLSNLNNFSLNLDENGFALSIIGAINSEKLKWLN